MRTTTTGKAYPVGYRGQVIRLAVITTQRISDDVPVAHYFATEETDFINHHWLPWLIMDEPIVYHRSAQIDTTSIALQNIDGQLESLLATERFEGAAIRILDYFTALGEGQAEAVERLRGQLTQRTANKFESRWQVVSRDDPQTIEAPARIVSRSCAWRFKSAQCGYTGTEFTTCPKTYAACGDRGQQHRFGGFIQVTQKLSVVYPPSDVGRSAGDEVLRRRNLTVS